MPPDGSPNYFVQLDDEAWGYDADQLEIFKFHVDWKVPSKSTFTGPSIIDLSAPGIGFDSTPERLIHRLAYRNFGDHESLVFDHSVNVNGADHAGIRWYEMRSPGSAPAIYQAGTYAPDADNRWNGSIAMDAQGNIALAYAVSSESTSASVRYAGRLAGDPLGTLPQNEITLGGGSVSRAFTSAIRGEFGSVTVDPADDCTFWLTHGRHSELGRRAMADANRLVQVPFVRGGPCRRRRGSEHEGWRGRGDRREALRGGRGFARGPHQTRRGRDQRDARVGREYGA